ncbi:division/cell wall cluster transcriptional repressor MraZ [Acetonema longum]|uniref:Transcriptional regulator MraZ n=1 Tax=Acetonema longum DSM 6540 TaxID=1009370 RepID=F7NPY6_9FIRM|nr:division/cell wall cluster transcriptional repressor MraZ [Acetonema longum]EGO61977.1 cell division protein MraZ [Acetonema longum DSM 6540]
MLLGEYSHSIDDKGRIILPAKFREELGDSFIATKGLEKCIFVYPKAEWSNIETKLKELPLAKAEARAFVRFFFAGAAEIECDKQGRMLLPGTLREYAALSKDVVVIGVLNRIELWDKDAWEAYNADTSQAVTEIAEQLADLGI